MEKRLLSTDSEINNWVDLWDKASADWETKEPQQPSAHAGGFFGLYDPKDNSDITIQETTDWQNVFYRSQQISELLGDRKEVPLKDSKINEAKSPKKPKKSKAKKKADDKEADSDDPRMQAIDNPNPIVAYSAGIDQEDPDTGVVRVSNFSSGEDLENLMNLMTTMSDLESKFLSADTIGNAEDSAKHFKSWVAMKKKARELSDKLQPKGKNDLAN